MAESILLKEALEKKDVDLKNLRDYITLLPDQLSFF